LFLKVFQRNTLATQDFTVTGNLHSIPLKFNYSVFSNIFKWLLSTDKIVKTLQIVMKRQLDEDEIWFSLYNYCDMRLNAADTIDHANESSLRRWKFTAVHRLKEIEEKSNTRCRFHAYVDRSFYTLDDAYITNDTVTLGNIFFFFSFSFFE